MDNLLRKNLLLDLLSLDDLLLDDLLTIQSSGEWPPMRQSPAYRRSVATYCEVTYSGVVQRMEVCRTGDAHGESRD